MKITKVECLVLDGEYPYAIVHTDTGHVGFGECFRRAPYVQKAAIETVFALLLMDRSPFDTDAIWDNMFAAGNVTHQIDQQGNATYFTYDRLNRQVFVHDPAGALTYLHYDQVGNQNERRPCPCGQNQPDDGMCCPRSHAARF